jgi:hypothetical protein
LDDVRLDSRIPPGATTPVGINHHISINSSPKLDLMVLSQPDCGINDLLLKQKKYRNQ